MNFYSCLMLVLIVLNATGYITISWFLIVFLVLLPWIIVILIFVAIFIEHRMNGTKRDE